jgi:hypothetical protein
MLVVCCSILKMEEVHSSETSINYQNTWHHIPYGSISQYGKHLRTVVGALNQAPDLQDRERETFNVLLYFPKLTVFLFLFLMG